MINIGDISIKELFVGSRPIDKAYIGDKLVYENIGYYGISFTKKLADTSRIRIGKELYHRTLPLLSQMKGCTITSDGLVKYLNSTDWTKYEDGSDRDYTLNTMVELPEFWALTIVEGDNVLIRLYMQRVNGAEHFPKQYVSAYEAVNDNKVLKSINNNSLKPSISIARTNFQNYARANGSDNWNAYTYKIHKAIALLYIVEYANMNSQLPVNSQLTTEGYKQGGLGNGATEGIVKINNVNTWSIFTCGCTDSLGNGSGQITQQFDNTDADGGVISTVTRTANRYRGIENPFGQIWKNTVDVVITYNEETGANFVYYTEDKTKFASNTLTDYEYRCNTITSNGWFVDLTYNPQFELFVPYGTDSGGGPSKYFADYYYSGASAAVRAVLLGGGLDTSSSAGLFYLNLGLDVSNTIASVGSRLIYLP